MNVILLSDDLMFTSRVAGTGRDLGVRVDSVRSAEALLDLAQRQPPSCIIVDLANAGLEIGDLIRSLGSLLQKPRVVAYGSHVDTAALQAARSAGCDIVLPRSKFVEELPTCLARWSLP